MKMKIFTYGIVLFIFISFSSALMALPTSGIKFENKKFTFQGITFERLCFSFGSSTVGFNGSEVNEIKTTLKPATTTYITKDYIITINEDDIKAIVCNKDRSYIEIKF